MSVMDAIGGGISGYLSGGGVGAAIGALGGLAGGGASDQMQAGIGRAGQLTEEGQRILGEQYGTAQGRYDPYASAGQQGLASYQQGMQQGGPQYGGFGAEQFNQYKDPGYQFRLEQGMQGLDRMSAKAGQRMSGQRGIGLQQYGQQMGSQEFGAARGRYLQDYGIQRGEYNQQMDRFKGLAGMGMDTANRLSGLDVGYGSAMSGSQGQLANLAVQGGQVGAASSLGMQNTLMSGLESYNYNQGFGGGGGNYGSPSYSNTTAASPAGEWSGFGRGL